MLKLKPQTKNILISGLAAIIVAIISFSACAWLTGQIKKITTSMESQQQLHFLLSNQQSVISTLQKDFSKIPPGFESKIEASLPPVSNILPMIDSLESLAKKNLLIATTNFSTPDLTTPILAGAYNLVPINFNTSLEKVSLNMLINYLNDLKRLPYFIEITSINVNSAAGWNNESSITLSGKIYARQ